MKKPEFSEFTFGYAFTHNFQDWLGNDFVGVPVFPSLLHEGRHGVGYDVAISTQSEPFLFQFKIPQIVTRRSRFLPPNFNPPYYRMHFEPDAKSTQHESLLTHSRKGRYVFYVSTRFDTLDALATHFNGCCIPANCLFVEPQDIGDLDEDAHFLAYDTSTADAWLFSENPRKARSPRSPEVIREEVRAAARRAAERPQEGRQEYFAGLSDELVASINETVKKLRDRPPKEHQKHDGEGYIYEELRPLRTEDVLKLVDTARNIEDPIERLAHLATFALDAQLVFVSLR